MYNKCDLFTEDENLFDRVTLKRVIEILNREDVTIYSCELSFNSYGQFLFISFLYQDSVISMFGLGEHSYRERWQDWFSIIGSEDVSHIPQGSSLAVKDREPLDKATVFKTIEERKARGRDYTYEQSEQGRVYELLADIGDEDGAATMIDDCYFYFSEEEGTE